LRLRLADVLDARSRLEETLLRRRRLLLGASALERELGIACVDAENQRAGIDTIAFLDVEEDNATADLWCKSYFSGFDMSGDTHLIRRWFFVARGGKKTCGYHQSSTSHGGQPQSS
jgi:hypothetical protein